MTQWGQMLKKSGVKAFCRAPDFLNTCLMGVREALLRARGAIDLVVGVEVVHNAVIGWRDGQAGQVVMKAVFRRDDV